MLVESLASTPEEFGRIGAEERYSSFQRRPMVVEGSIQHHDRNVKRREREEKHFYRLER
jgi:hypothetical protein